LQAAGLLPQDSTCEGEMGDDAVVRIINDEIAVVENVDVFTPIHDDPFIQGQIVACNATNDLFAMGVTDVLSLQAFLAYPDKLPESIAVGVLKGMNDFMGHLGAKISGGQTITNPCPVFGGIALGVTHPRNVVYSSGARPGDIAVLTKPLGIQSAMRSYRDLKDEKRDKLLAKFTESSLLRIQSTAVRLMTQSNLEVAQVMAEVGVKAATDITGFGLLGHANNVCALSGIDVVIDRMPVIKGTLELAQFFGHRLAAGYGAETAGGMLVFLSPGKVDSFHESLAAHRLPCWTIGVSKKPSGPPCATLAHDIEYIETEFP
jgi:selenide,water dikinase